MPGPSNLDQIKRLRQEAARAWAVALGPERDERVEQIARDFDELAKTVAQRLRQERNNPCFARPRLVRTIKLAGWVAAFLGVACTVWLLSYALR
jgi:hypothetical protein